MRKQRTIINSPWRMKRYRVCVELKHAGERLIKVTIRNGRTISLENLVVRMLILSFQFTIYLFVVQILIFSVSFNLNAVRASSLLVYVLSGNIFVYLT